MRVLMFLKKWLEGRRRGEMSQPLLAEIVTFIETRLPQDGLQDMQQVLLRLAGGNTQEKVITYDRRQAPKPKHPKVKVLDRMGVLDIDPVELARQLVSEREGGEE